MARPVAILLGLFLMFSGALRADAGTVSLSLHDGLVTITAKDASVRQIITEWQRVGRTVFVNADGLTGPPITLQLSNVPERQALDLILSSAAGYMAAPRSTRLPGASAFDLVFVLPTSTAPAAPPTPTRREPEIYYPSEVPGQPRVPIFRPTFPRPRPVQPEQRPEPSGAEESTQQAPPASTGITAPVVSPQPGLVVIPPKKKPDGGGR